MPSKKRSHKKSSHKKSHKRSSTKRSGLKLVSIKKSPKKDKKLVATFEQNGRTKQVHFGAAGMSDYTKHKDLQRKHRYENRHKKNENWNDPTTAGALSKHILWNKPSLKASISDFKKKFGL
jgi:hypothetical protein